MSTPINLATFDASKVTFSEVKKLEKGGSINILYEGKPLVIKSRALRVPFNVNQGFQGKPKKGEAPAEPKPDDKFELQLDLPDSDENKPMRAVLDAIDKAFMVHLTKNATTIYGETGLGLKAKALADSLKAVAAGTSKTYPLIKASDNAAYPDKFRLKWAPNSPVQIISKKNTPLAPKDIVRGSSVTAIFKIRGYFISEVMVSAQVDPIALCVAAGATIDASALFADDLDEDAEVPAASSEGSPNKRQRLEDPVDV